MNVTDRFLVVAELVCMFGTFVAAPLWRARKKAGNSLTRLSSEHRWEFEPRDRASQASLHLSALHGRGGATQSKSTNEKFSRRFASVVFLTLWSGCTMQPLQQHLSTAPGRIETIAESAHGVVVGVPRGALEPAALDYAKSIRVKTQAGIVAAYGFASRQIQVSEPVYHGPLRQRGSIYSEFRSSLRAAAGGPIRFYIGLRVDGSRHAADRIEVAAAGFSRRQLQDLKERFVRRTRKEPLEDRVDLALEPLDEITWDSSGARHHGVLLASERGLSIRLPARLAQETVQSVYQGILSDWVADAVAIAGSSAVNPPEIVVTMLPHGKIELIPGTGGHSGIVIAAPHGTFDAYTGGLVRRFCAATGLAGVVATGFTPTESGDGWRINVNRPSERHATLALPEAETRRAQQTYEQFKRNVFSAAHGRLDLYIDIHQNSGTRIEVATLGISRDEARFIKEAYHTLRERALIGRKDLAAVELAIEPVDQIEVGAWPAKEFGILRLARKSLHFELPGHGLMGSPEHRDVYGLVLSQLLRHIAVPLAALKRPSQEVAPFTASSR